MDGYGPGDSGWRGLRNVSVSCCGVWDECMESVHCLDEEVGATEWEVGIRTVGLQGKSQMRVLMIRGE